MLLLYEVLLFNLSIRVLTLCFRHGMTGRTFTSAKFFPSGGMGTFKKEKNRKSLPHKDFLFNFSENFRFFFFFLVLKELYCISIISFVYEMTKQIRNPRTNPGYEHQWTAVSLYHFRLFIVLCVFFFVMYSCKLLDDLNFPPGKYFVFYSK